MWAVNNVVYLLIAVGVSAVGLLVLWVRNRPPASSPRSSVEEFHSTLRALAPDDDVSDSGRTPGRGA
jgi:hypothetical protein